jgi:sporulation protein YlmC with PRC-barrel domain
MLKYLRGTIEDNAGGAKRMVSVYTQSSGQYVGTVVSIDEVGFELHPENSAEKIVLIPWSSVSRINPWNE